MGQGTMSGITPGSSGTKPGARAFSMGHGQQNPTETIVLNHDLHGMLSYNTNFFIFLALTNCTWRHIIWSFLYIPRVSQLHPTCIPMLFGQIPITPTEPIPIKWLSTVGYIKVMYTHAYTYPDTHIHILYIHIPSLSVPVCAREFFLPPRELFSLSMPHRFPGYLQHVKPRSCHVDSISNVLEPFPR